MTRFERTDQDGTRWLRDITTEPHPAFPGRVKLITTQWRAKAARATGESSHSIWSSDDIERYVAQKHHTTHVEGWHRVFLAQTDDEPRLSPLEAALLAQRPLDPATALAYADWLQERGHPRGALIVVQHAIGGQPGDRRLEVEQARILDAHAPQLLGSFARYLPAEQDAPSLSRPRVVLEWELGFIVAARLVGNFPYGDFQQVYFDLVHHPSARFLRDLAVGDHHASLQAHREILQLVLAARPAPPLRRLVVTSRNLENLGDLSTLAKTFPQLEEVALSGEQIGLGGAWCLPNALRFALRTSQISSAVIAALFRSSWPELVDLELSGRTRSDDLAPLFSGELMPKLRKLRFSEARNGDELCLHLDGSQLAKRLIELDLSFTGLSDQGIDLIIAARASLPGLKLLRIDGFTTTLPGRARLRASGIPFEYR